MDNRQWILLGDFICVVTVEEINICDFKRNPFEYKSRTGTGTVLETSDLSFIHRSSELYILCQCIKVK